MLNYVCVTGKIQQRKSDPMSEINTVTVDENRVCSKPVPVLSFGGYLAHSRALVKPLLTKLEHVPVREHLCYIAHEALGGQHVAPPKGLLAILDLDTTVEERKLRRRLHLAEHLSYGELLVEE